MPPRTLLLPVLLLATLLSMVGCGSWGSEDSSTTTFTEPRSPLDIGPRAGDSPVAVILAARGEVLFKKKGCTVCHAYGVRLTGPDLKGVTRRRTAQWMERQMLHPDIMVYEDPLTRDLFAEYNLMMANQGLQPDEAKCIVEHLKRLDEEAELRGELTARR